MTFEQLIEEGRKLQRQCVFLRPKRDGPVAAIWYERDAKEIEATGHRLWLTVDARHVPGLSPSITGYISVFTDEKKFKGGRVDLTPTWPRQSGTELYAHAASVLPPIDAVFARGSDSVGEWISSLGWERTYRYNDNFPDRDLVWKYEQVWKREFPLYFKSDIYAVLGGWHMPFADHDWHDLIDDCLMVLTDRDSEPWVEAWLSRTRQFKVIQRIS